MYIYIYIYIYIYTHIHSICIYIYIYIYVYIYISIYTHTSLSLSLSLSLLGRTRKHSSSRCRFSRNLRFSSRSNTIPKQETITSGWVVVPPLSHMSYRIMYMSYTHGSFPIGLISNWVRF